LWPYAFLTPILDGGSGQLQAPADFYLETKIFIGKEARWTPELVWIALETDKPMRAARSKSCY